MVNIENLKLGLKLVEEANERGEWVQETWLMQRECGTAGCFAGHWALHQGYTPVWDLASGSEAACVILPSGERKTVSQVAQEDMGLNFSQAQALFDSDNTLEDLRLWVNRFAGEPQL